MSGVPGRYSGGGQSISEPRSSNPRVPDLTGTWNSTTNDYVGYIYFQARPVDDITLSPGVTAGC